MKQGYMAVLHRTHCAFCTAGRKLLVSGVSDTSDSRQHGCNNRESKGPLWGSLQMTQRTYQYSLVTQLCQTLCGPTDCSIPDFPVHHQLLELAQTHIHQVSNAIQPSHPLSSPSPSTFNLSQHQGLFQCVCSSHQVAKVLEFQLQHQSFQ